MPTTVISGFRSQDMRFALQAGEGSDAVHSDPQYSFAVTHLDSTAGLVGTGLTLTMGAGNGVVCDLISLLAPALVGLEIEELMSDFGNTFRKLSDHHQIRWLGPHKGAVHLALASITNACFDLWAKSRGIPLWRLLLNLEPAKVIRLLDLSYLEGEMDDQVALEILEANRKDRCLRERVLNEGYPGYDTSVGWFRFGDAQIRENAKRAMAVGFRAFKLKVGSSDAQTDVQRAHMLRETVGDGIPIMLDANQQWSLPKAINVCQKLAPMSPFWIEEPTHPDDVFAHQVISREISPIPLAIGEHVPNRVAFKNYLQAGCIKFLQVDCTRVGGISEFITVSLLARKFGVPVVPHVGDMGQIHQHLVLFNHIAMGHSVVFLEYIPHLQHWFVDPAQVEGGKYRTPQKPGSSSDLLTERVFSRTV
jgi:L-fuconate dehydratase